MQLHLDIGVGWHFKPGEEFIVGTGNWLCKLYSSNKVTGIFPKNALKKILSDRWYLQINASMTCNQFNGSIVFLRIGLWNISFRTIYRLMKLIFKPRLE
jgi:hypothetical protein